MATTHHSITSGWQPDCFSCYSQHSLLLWNYPEQGLWDKSPGHCNFPGCSVSLEDLVLMTRGLDAAKIPDPDGMGQPDYIAGLLGEIPLDSSCRTWASGCILTSRKETRKTALSKLQPPMGVQDSEQELRS